MTTYARGAVQTHEILKKKETDKVRDFTVSENTVNLYCIFKTNKQTDKQKIYLYTYIHTHTQANKHFNYNYLKNLIILTIRK